MLNFIKIFGTYNSRIIKKYWKVVAKINALEEQMIALSDEELSNKTQEFRSRLDNGENLQDLLPEAFAVVREASKRVTGMRHFDVQLIGAMALNDACVAEMKTGEGKTLVATLAAYLNALPGKGVHVVTVNDYLATRDARWMGKIYNFLGLSVGVIESGMYDHLKRDAYNCDITYGTNHEFGFDYLRDNLKFDRQDMVMRPFNYAIIDEVDSILIDEARTPLIISGPDSGSVELYQAVDSVVSTIKEGEFEKDEKSRIVSLTDAGVEKCEAGLRKLGLLPEDESLYAPGNVNLVYHVNCALSAHKLFTKDVNYVVKNNQVMIVDEFTGRIMNGRRYSEGIHQAIEAKERVTVNEESQTIATISYQNLFRLYPKLSGMTGTAMTEEAEFDEIYKLKVVTIPPNKPVARVDEPDCVFFRMKDKYNAVVELIKECHAKQQPVLVGTTSIEKSEYLSSLLSQHGIKHNVLNAKNHEREAYIVAEAGVPSAVTIATNMAGRGTDIKLGGSIDMRIEQECGDMPEGEEKDRMIAKIKQEVAENHDKVVASGGLYIIGTERNESRRVDNQLRGRAGRQGDPGRSRFFVSFDDELLVRFGSQRVPSMLKISDDQEDKGTQSRFVAKIIEKSQARLEAFNFDIRKQLLRYDDVMNDQRKIVYKQRDDIMDTEDLMPYVTEMSHDVLTNMLADVVKENTVPDQWDMTKLVNFMKKTYSIDIDSSAFSDKGMTPELLKTKLEEQIDEKLQQKMEEIGADDFNTVVREIILDVLDQNWKKHLVALEHLRRGINLRSYAQQNPLNAYKLESFNLFQYMLNQVKNTGIAKIYSYVKPEESDISGRISFDDIELPNFEELMKSLTEVHNRIKKMQANVEEQKQENVQSIIEQDVKVETNVEKNEDVDVKKSNAKQNTRKRKIVNTEVKEKTRTRGTKEKNKDDSKPKRGRPKSKKDE